MFQTRTNVPASNTDVCLRSLVPWVRGIEGERTVPPSGPRAAPGDPLRRALLGQFAEDLWRAEQDAVAAHRISSVLPDLTMDEAEEIRRLGDLLRMEARSTPIGRHICFGRRGALIDHGLGEPRWGYIFSHQRFLTESPIQRSRFMSPRLSAALAFDILTDVTSHQEAEVRQCLSQPRPAFAILDSRTGSWDLTTAEIVADNGLCGGFVPGQPADEASLDELDLVTARITRRNRRSLTELGRASDLRGGPLSLVLWLAQAALVAGEPLRAGETVLVGPLTGPIPIEPRNEYIGEFAGFGRELLLVSVRFT